MSMEWKHKTCMWLDRKKLKWHWSGLKAKILNECAEKLLYAKKRERKALQEEIGEKQVAELLQMSGREFVIYVLFHELTVLSLNNCFKDIFRPAHRRSAFHVSISRHSVHRNGINRIRCLSYPPKVSTSFQAYQCG